MPLERDLVVRYTASAFVDAGSLVGDNRLIRELGTVLVPIGLSPLPMGFQQGAIVGQIPFAGFASVDGLEQLILTTVRFDFNFLGRGPKSSTTPTWAQHVERSAEVLELVLTACGRPSHRLAFISEEIATVATNEGLDPNAVARLLLRLPPNVADPLAEWVYKFGVRVPREGEVINSFAEAGHVHGSMQGSSFEGVRFQMDANTTPDDSRARFGPDAVGRWLNVLMETAAESLAQIDLMVDRSDD